MITKIVLACLMAALVATLYWTLNPLFTQQGQLIGLESHPASQGKQLLNACLIYQSEHGVWPAALTDLPRSQEIMRIEEYQKSQGRSLATTFQYKRPNLPDKTVVFVILGKYCLLDSSKNVFVYSDGSREIK